TTLVPPGICFRVDTVSVQNPPASPEYCAQFFTAWKLPARGEDSENDRAPSASATSAAAKPGTTLFGAVESEQAVMTTEAMMAVAMRSLRRIIGASVQLRFVTGDAFALDRADTALHDRPSPSAEHQIKLTGLA